MAARRRNLTVTSGPQKSAKLQGRSFGEGEEEFPNFEDPNYVEPRISGHYPDGTPVSPEEQARLDAEATANADQPTSPKGSSLDAQIAFNEQTKGGQEIQEDIAQREAKAEKTLRDVMAGTDLRGQFDPLADGSTRVGKAADQAEDALGRRPNVQMGLADRRNREFNESLGMSREVMDRLLNGPSTAERLGSQTLRSQMALARSASGGPGAVAGAMRQAFAGAPELQAQATEQAVAEEMQKLNTAGNVASNFAQAALGARGQDIDIAKKNVDSGLAVMGMIADLTGTQLELDQRNTELLGQMGRDLAAQPFDWGSLDAETTMGVLDNYLEVYGIDSTTAAQLKELARSGKIEPKDIFNGLVGAGGAAASIYATSRR